MQSRRRPSCAGRQQARRAGAASYIPTWVAVLQRRSSLGQLSRDDRRARGPRSKSSHGHIAPISQSLCHCRSEIHTSAFHPHGSTNARWRSTNIPPSTRSSSTCAADGALAQRRSLQAALADLCAASPRLRGALPPRGGRDFERRGVERATEPQLSCELDSPLADELRACLDALALRVLRILTDDAAPELLPRAASASAAG